MSVKAKTKLDKKFTLIAWQDSDVADQIKDKSFVGSLASSSNKENHESNANGDLLKTNDKKPLIKRRVSKRASLSASAAAAASANDLSLDQMTVSSSSLNEQHQQQQQQNAPTRHMNKASAHFVFGNQAVDGTAMSSKTSNNKLEQSHRISYHEMSEVLKTFKNPIANKTIDELNRFYETQCFPEWFKLMSFGFNVLIHGLGSKKALLQNFAQTYLASYYQVELLGYHYDFNPKNIFKSIISDVLGLTEYYKTYDEQLTVINQHLDKPLYMVIHNIDGNCFRDSSIQFCLSELATNKYVHIIASIDHINSSLLWDQMQCSSFKWINFEINTLVPYNDEIMFENSLMLSQNTNVQLSSMIHILKSLTQNAKNIFLTMVQHVLNPENVKKSITFNKLYHECREKFFVSNELTLRAQLTEFIDHKIIKLKAESDGYETIYLLIDEKNLKLYLEDLKDKV